MLQDYLNENLLTITDESHAEKLKKASTEASKLLLKNKKKIILYTLAASDPQIPADNPEILEVKELIIKKLTTFSSISKDTPITFIRAVMLEALKDVATDIHIATAIWLTGRNIAKYYKIIGKESEIISTFFQSLGTRVNKKAIESWSLSDWNSSTNPNSEIKQLPHPMVETAALQKQLEDAIAPNNKSGSPNFSSPNPYWSDDPQNWAYEFAPRAAKAIAASINKSIKEQSDQYFANQKSLNAALVAIQSDGLSKVVNIKSELLWWKESCYSISLDKSYRTMLPGELQFAFALDYSSFVPNIYPKSAEYFLKETHNKLVTEDTGGLTFLDFMNFIVKSRDELQKVIPSPIVETGRISLLDFIKGIVWNKHQVDQFENLVGFPAEKNTSMSEITLYIFDDIQADKSTNNK